MYCTTRGIGKERLSMKSVENESLKLHGCAMATSLAESCNKALKEHCITNSMQAKWCQKWNAMQQPCAKGQDKNKSNQDKTRSDW